MKGINLKITRLDHIAIEVKDLALSIQFYVDLLGIKELATPDAIRQKGIHWLKLDDRTALHLVENKTAAPPQTAHIALNVDNVSKWREYLVEHGIEIHQPKFDLYNAERFFLFDPSGNRIEFVKWQK